MRGRNGDRGKLTDWKPTRGLVARRAVIRINGERDAVMGEGKFGTMQGLSPRSPGETRQDPHAAPAILGLFEENLLLAQGKGVMFGPKLQDGSRFLSGENGGFGGPAEAFHGARFTSRSCLADEGAQFHERGVMPASVSARQEARGRRPEMLASRARVDGRLQVEQTGEDAGDVCFDDWSRSVEREGGHGVCRVTANARQIPNRFHVSRERAAMFFRNGDGGGAEISGAGVVAKTLPGVENVVFGGGGERGEVGEAPEPLIIIRNDGGDLGLLEHEFGNEDGVGIGGAAPGESASIFAIPGKKGAAKRRRGIGIHGLKKTSNAQRRTSNTEFRVFHSILDVGRWAFDVCPFLRNDFLHSPAHDEPGREA